MPSPTVFPKLFPTGNWCPENSALLDIDIWDLGPSRQVPSHQMGQLLEHSCPLHKIRDTYGPFTPTASTVNQIPKPDFNCKNIFNKGERWINTLVLVPKEDRSYLKTGLRQAIKDP